MAQNCLAALSWTVVAGRGSRYLPGAVGLEEYAASAVCTNPEARTLFTLALSHRNTCTTLLASCLLSIHLSAEAPLLMPVISPANSYQEAVIAGPVELGHPPQSPMELLLSQLHAIKPIRIFPRHAAARCATLLWGVRQGSMAIGYRIGFLLIVPRRTCRLHASCRPNCFPAAGTAG